MKTDRFDLISGLYAFVCHYHSGQWSREYRILSRITTRYNPRNIPIEAIAENNNTDWQEASEVYQRLVKNYANKM